MILLTLCSLLAVAANTTVPAGTQLNYRGRFVADKGDLAATEKQFAISYVVTKHTDAATSLAWVSEERGCGGWSWPDRFGKWDLNEPLRAAGGVGPTLSYQRHDGTSIIPLPVPFLTYAESFSVGLMWFEGNLEFHVAAEEKVNGHDTWRIDARSPVGRRRSIWVEKTSPVIIAASETVFIGQGEQHDLRWELVSREILEAEPLAAANDAFDELLRLRTRLDIEPQTQDVRWTADRIALLKADLPAVLEKTKGTPVEKLAQAIEQDAKNQKDRANAIGAIRGKLVGRAAPQPPLEAIQGEKFAWPDVKGKVVVLHFWNYADTPLEEPYGQVAYLDFLSRQHKKGGVLIYGIVTDERATQSETKRTGISSAKKFHSFMNLSYPLLVDSGAAIKEFGDPRATGAKLPLFVVIDPQGQVVHYHAGFYEVNRDRGLEELGMVIKQAIEKRTP